MADEKPPEHVELYNKIIKAVPIDYIDERDHMHQDALGNAHGALKGKKFKTLNEGIEGLVDAYFAYAKEVKDPTVIGKDHKEHDKYRHRYVSEIREFINNYVRSNARSGVTMDQVVKQMRSGKTYKLLQQFLDAKHAQDLDSKVEHEIGKLIPEDKDPKFYQSLLSHHYKTTSPKDTLPKGFIEENGNYLGIRGTLSSALREQQMNAKYLDHKYTEPKKDDTKKK
ncbi:MAG: hypothetical protein WC916_02080 [Candidatus Woesearchaeota archaeon]